MEWTRGLRASGEQQSNHLVQEFPREHDCVLGRLSGETWTRVTRRQVRHGKPGRRHNKTNNNQHGVGSVSPPREEGGRKAGVARVVGVMGVMGVMVAGRKQEKKQAATSTKCPAGGREP